METRQYNTRCQICRHEFKSGEEYATSEVRVMRLGSTPMVLFDVVLCENCMDKHGDGYVALGNGGSGRKYDFETGKRIA